MLTIGNRVNIGSPNARAGFEVSGLNGLSSDNPYVRQHSEGEGNVTDNRDHSVDLIINNQIERSNSHRAANFSPGNNNPPREHANAPPQFVGSAPNEPDYDEEAIVTRIRDIIFNVLKWNTLGLFLFIFLLVSVNWNLSFYYPLVFLWLADVYFIVSTLNTSPGEKQEKCIKVLDILLIMLFKMAIALYFEFGQFKLVYTLIPVVAFQVWMSIRDSLNQQLNFFKRFDFCGELIKFFILIQSILITMKIDNLIQTSWRNTFWCFWVLLAISSGICFACVMILSVKCCSLLFSEIETFEMRGMAWTFMIMVGTTICSTWLVMCILQVLEDGLPQSNITNPIIGIICYSLVMLTFTISHFKEIEKFMRKMAAVSENGSAAPSHRQLPKKEEKKEPEKLEIPKFLTKFSSTYFRRATENEITVAKEKKEKKEAKKPLIKPPGAGHHKYNSSDYSRLTKNTSTATDIETNIKSGANLMSIPETTDRIDQRNNVSQVEPTSGRRLNKLPESSTNRLGVLGILPILSARDVKLNNEETDTKRTQMVPSSVRGNRTSESLIALSRRLASTATKKDGNPNNQSELLDINRPSGGRHKRIHSVQVTPQNIFININSPKPETPKGDIGFVDAIQSGLQSPVMSNRSMAQQCLICMDKDPDAVFMECGHGGKKFIESKCKGVCYDCSLEVWKSTAECYLCRNKIVQILQIDMKTRVGDVLKVISSTQMVMYEEEEEY